MISKRTDLERITNKKEWKSISLSKGDVTITVTVYVFYGKWEKEDGNPI
jgi:hypothetical protein